MNPILVMFDIDGTLLDSVDLDEALFTEVVETVIGEPISQQWDHYEHVTDFGIVAENLRRLDRASEFLRVIEEVEARFVARLDEKLRGLDVAVLQKPGAAQLLEKLQGDRRFKLAIGTGGFGASARLKLRNAGLNVDGIAFASCNDAVSRTEIMSVAESRALAQLTPSRRVYFGDGAWDKKASLQLGYDFFPVEPIDGHEGRVWNLDDPDLLTTLASI